MSVSIASESEDFIDWNWFKKFFQQYHNNGVAAIFSVTDSKCMFFFIFFKSQVCIGVVETDKKVLSIIE